MGLAKEMWDTLSALDVREHIEKKGRFNYLSWAWAWGEFSKLYPECVYELSVASFEDGTMEAQCYITVIKGEEVVKRNMWLPVLDFSNKAIKNPNAYDINKTKMRCLVKCLAMYGLGHYIYAGEDLPEGEESADPFERVPEKAAVDDDKPWFNEADFEQMRDKFQASIQSGERTGPEIVKNLRKNFKVNNQFKADIEGLA